MKKMVILNFKDCGLYKYYWVQKGKHIYFVVLSKYGATVIKKI